MCDYTEMNEEQFKRLLNKQFANDTRNSFVNVKLGEDVISGCFLFEADNIMTMGSVYTIIGKRRKGYAQQLLDRVKKVFHNSNKKVLIATVEKDSFVEKFYIKNGFSVVGSYDGNESIIIIHK